MNSAPGGQYSLENSAWGTVFTSENCLGGHFLGGAKFPMTPVLHALGWNCVGVWSITMVATHLPQKACDAHVTSFTRPSSRLTNSFFPASKIVTAKESERDRDLNQI